MNDLSAIRDALLNSPYANLSRRERQRVSVCLIDGRTIYGAAAHSFIAKQWRRSAERVAARRAQGLCPD